MTRKQGVRLLALVFLAGAALSTYKWLSPTAHHPSPGPRPTIPSRRATTPDTTLAYPRILVDASWLRSHLSDPGILVVDARPIDRFRRGHVPGAAHVDPREWNGDPPGLAGLLGRSGVSEARNAVCVSGPEDPAAAGELFWLLELAGLRNVRVLAGGIETWRTSGGSIEPGELSATPCLFQARPDTSLLADVRYVQTIIGQQGYTILDPRSEEDWEAGHIPHSLPLTLDSLATSGPRPGAAIRLAFQNWGPRDNDFVDLDDEIVIGGDVPSNCLLHAYLAARLAGLKKLRVYPEGFQGWRARSHLPIVRLVSTAELRRRLAEEGGGKLTDVPPRGFIFLDLRERGDYDRGHIPGAINVPSYQFPDTFEAVVANRWPEARRESTPFIVYCYGVQCIRSRNCASLAARHGYQALEWYREGVDGWRALGESLTRPGDWAPRTFH